MLGFEIFILFRNKILIFIGVASNLYRFFILGIIINEVPLDMMTITIP